LQRADSTESFPHTGRFTFRRRLGSGGFGVVYEADDHERATRVALKTLHHVDATALYHFKNEFRALCDIVHPNLVALHELVSEGERWFFTMDLIEGTDFYTFLRHGRPSAEAHALEASPGAVRESDGVTLTSGPGSAPDAGEGGGPPQAGAEGNSHSPVPTPAPASLGALSGVDLERLRSVLLQLGEGVLALHAAGKLHRDLKPSNVLVTPEGRVVILDFGLVVDFSPSETVQWTGDLAGTPAYMAPEQARSESASPASDWYAVGVMLYEALTGRRPFGGTTLDILTRKLREEPPPPSAVAKGIPDDLDALCVELLRALPLDRPSGAEVLRRLRSSCPPSEQASSPGALFMGRERHLAALRDAFQQAVSGRATTVHVRGVSGMGKSMLVRRFLDELLGDDRAVVLEGRCYERESVPYKAVDSLIDCLSRHLSGLPAREATELMPGDVRAIVRLFPVLGRVGAIAALIGAPRQEPEPSDAQELRRLGFGGLRELLSRMATRRPLVLHIDDLQWGDADSAALLADLLREPDPPGLLLVLGYRSEDAEKSALLRTLPAPSHSGDRERSEGAVRELVVGPLEREEALALALGVLGSAGAGDRAESIVAEAAGSPFFVHELARAVRGRPGELAGGIRLETVLADRLSRLSAEARRLLEVIAVAGGPLRRAVARQASTLSPEHERSAMDVLRAERVLRARGAGEGEELETFHDRIRETILAQLGAREQVLRHLDIATALEASGGAEPDALLLHFRRAERPDKAVPYAILAGDRAAQELAFDQAAARFAYALEAGATDAGDNERRALLIKLGDALRNGGRGAEAAPAFAAAADGAPAQERLELRWRAAEQLLLSGQLDDGKVALRGVLASIGMTLFQRPALAVLSLLAHQALIWLLRLRSPWRLAQVAPAASLRRLEICWSAVVGLAGTDNVLGAELHAKYLVLALRAGDRSHLSRALALAIPFGASDNLAGRRRAERDYRLAAALASEVGDPYLIGVTRCFMGVFEGMMGSFVESCVHARAAEQVWLQQCSGTAWELSTARFVIMSSLLYRGELRELSRMAIPVCEETESRGDLLAATHVRVTFTYWVPLAADRPDLARDEVLGAMSRWSQRGFNLIHLVELLALVRIDLYASQPLAARQRLKDGWPRVTRSFLQMPQINRVLLYSLGASCALAAAASSDASDERLTRTLLREAERDVRRLAREDVPWAQALADSLRAPLAVLQGDPASALSFLERAASRFDACGMGLHAAASWRRCGELTGGEEGRAAIEAADLWMADQGIRNPVRMAALLAPGFRQSITQAPAGAPGEAVVPGEAAA
jgi:eukaryotic-like serine/threonine-protein kinase